MTLETWIKLWVDGGWTMIPLFVVCVLIYVSAVRLLVHLSRRGFQHISDSDWMGWVRNPAQGQGKVGEIIRYTQDQVKNLPQIQSRFAEVVSSEVPELDRRLTFVNVFISAAPLLGLLGTVLGMLTTFHGIAHGGGKMVDQIASGISEALITTEMGLLIALPGMVLSYMIRRRRNEHVAFLARLESYTIQQFQRKPDRLTKAVVRKSPVRRIGSIARQQTADDRSPATPATA